MHCALIVGHQAIYDVTKNSWTQKPYSYTKVVKEELTQSQNIKFQELKLKSSVVGTH